MSSGKKILGVILITPFTLIFMVVLYFSFRDVQWQVFVLAGTVVAFFVGLDLLDDF